MKLPTKEAAKLFADGFEKGREAGIAHASKEQTKATKRLAYIRYRAKALARWRRYAIDRLGLGPVLVTEIDKASRKSTT
jgi:hypothetical protein